MAIFACLDDFLIMKKFTCVFLYCAVCTPTQNFAEILSPFSAKCSGGSSCWTLAKVVFCHTALVGMMSSANISNRSLDIEFLPLDAMLGTPIIALE